MIIILYSNNFYCTYTFCILQTCVYSAAYQYLIKIFLQRSSFTTNINNNFLKINNNILKVMRYTNAVNFNEMRFYSESYSRLRFTRIYDEFSLQTDKSDIFFYLSENGQSHLNVKSIAWDYSCPIKITDNMAVIGRGLHYLLEIEESVGLSKLATELRWIAAR